VAGIRKDLTSKSEKELNVEGRKLMAQSAEKEAEILRLKEMEVKRRDGIDDLLNAKYKAEQWIMAPGFITEKQLKQEAAALNVINETIEVKKKALAENIKMQKATAKEKTLIDKEVDTYRDAITYRKKKTAFDKESKVREEKRVAEEKKLRAWAEKKVEETGVIDPATGKRKVISGSDPDFERAQASKERDIRRLMIERKRARSGRQLTQAEQIKRYKKEVGVIESKREGGYESAAQKVGMEASAKEKAEYEAQRGQMADMYGLPSGDGGGGG
jgi:hypothetical protein